MNIKYKIPTDAIDDSITFNMELRPGPDGSAELIGKCGESGTQVLLRFDNKGRVSSPGFIHQDIPLQRLTTSTSRIQVLQLFMVTEPQVDRDSPVKGMHSQCKSGQSPRFINCIFKKNSL